MTASGIRSAEAPDASVRRVDDDTNADLVTEPSSEHGWFGPAGGRRWFVITLAVVTIAAIVPLAFYHRYYFDNDTESGAFGVWYRLGMELRSGHVQIFNPHAWMAGNYVVEGQWGLFNPVILLISLLASYSANAIVFSSILKIVFMVIGAGGVFVLARSYGADPRWAAIVGTAAPLAGFTMYMDATAWVTGLFIWAFLPWFWVALRRTVYGGRNPAWALVTAYLTVTVGYVYGAIGVTFVLLGVGVFAGLITITVYLPGILTSHVTWRESGISNSGFLQPSLTGLATSAQPTARPELPGFWGPFPHAPILYIAWFLPMLALVDWHKARQFSRGMVDAFLAMTLFAMLLFSPSQVGPLRFPVRNMPMFVMALLPLVAVMLSRARAPRKPGRLLGAAALTMGGAYFAFSQKPATAKSVLIATVITLIAVWYVWRSSPRPATEATAPHPRADATALPRPNALPTRAAALMLAISVAFVALQHHSAKQSDLADFKLPASVSAYKAVEPNAVGDGIVVGGGDVSRSIPLSALWREYLIGNTWYMTNHSFQNVYTPVGFSAYGGVVCMNYLGTTCSDLLRRLFTVRPATGMLLVDELGIDTVEILKGGLPPSAWSAPELGWSVLNDQPLTITWTRDHPIGPAGKPVLTSAGTSIQLLSNTDRTVRFRVNQVAPGGGTVAFSRLNWPGYSARNASVTTPADHFLLQVHVPSNSAGKVVTVTFTPPGWRLGWVCWSLALLGGLCWVVIAARASRRRQATPA